MTNGNEARAGGSLHISCHAAGNGHDISHGEEHGHDSARAHSHGLREQLHEHEHVHEPMACDGEGHEHHHHPDGSCCCHHHDAEYHEMPLSMKVRLAMAAALFVVCLIVPTGDTLDSCRGNSRI